MPLVLILFHIHIFLVKGDMEAFCGKARLLVTSKCKKQYQKMIDDALSPTYSPPTKVSDLTGFWEMVQIQVSYFLLTVLFSFIK